MKVISILNYKGGVGKTTFTVSTSQALALAGFRVLAIDNDGQHNLSLLLGNKAYRPNIRDVYLSSLGNAGKNFMHSIRETGLKNLHIVTSQSGLCSSEVKDHFILQKTFLFCALYKFYDFVLIDNGPGLDILQEAAIHASDEIFMPTELSYFAINGIQDIHRIISNKFRNECYISKIIPNFYKNTKSHKKYLASLKELFPGKVTNTTIPYDTTFDECMREGKTLFINRLYSKAAAYYLKLMHELFDLDEEKTWEQVVEKRKNHLSNDARKRYYNRKTKERKENAPPGELLRAFPIKYDKKKTTPDDIPQSATMTM